MYVLDNVVFKIANLFPEFAIINNLLEKKRNVFQKNELI